MERFTEDDTPERIFERKWGHELMARVRRRLAESYGSKGKAAIFEALQPVLLAGGSLRGQDAPGIAASLSMTDDALRVALNRFLKDYRELLEDEVSETVIRPEDVEDEIGQLMRIFCKA